VESVTDRNICILLKNSVCEVQRAALRKSTSQIDPGSTIATSASAYFRPSRTAFQADRGRDFSVIADGVSV